MAQHTIGPMQLLVTIVERGQGRFLMEYYKKFKVLDHIQAAGRGTAASHLLDTLGFGTSERDVIIRYGSEVPFVTRSSTSVPR